MKFLLIISFLLLFFVGCNTNKPPKNESIQLAQFKQQLNEIDQNLRRGTTVLVNVNVKYNNYLNTSDKAQGETETIKSKIFASDITSEAGKSVRAKLTELAEINLNTARHLNSFGKTVRRDESTHSSEYWKDNSDWKAFNQSLERYTDLSSKIDKLLAK